MRLEPSNPSKKMLSSCGSIKIDQRNDQLKTGDVVALRTLEMKELDPEEFSSLQVGEVLDITYFNMNEENDIPVLYVSRWELQTQ